MTDSIDDREQRVLAALEKDFLRALALKDAGKLNDAEEDLRKILLTEPRLAEPRMELARILLDTNRVSEALEHARSALQHLEQGGQWIDTLPENVVLALGHALLAEVLRRRADEDDVIFGDPNDFRAMLGESQEHFAKASELDPSDEYSSYYGFFLGLSDNKGPVQLRLEEAQDL